MMSLILHNKFTEQSNLSHIIYFLSFFNIRPQSNFPLSHMLNAGSVPQKALLPKMSFTGKIAQFLHGRELHLGLPAALQNSRHY